MQSIEPSVFSRRAWLFLAELTGIGVLALWSLSAFFEHLDELKASAMAYWGAAGTEVIMVILAAFACFCWKVRARQEAHILNAIVALVILVHSGGVRGLLSAKTEQTAAESRLAENLNKLTQQTAGTAQSLARRQSRTIGAGNAAKAAQGTVAQANQQAVNSLAEFTAQTQNRVAESSLFPRWYINGGMFSLMFIVGFLALSRVGYLAHFGQDVDRDFDGTVDAEEEEEIQQTEIPLPKGHARH